MSNKPTKDWLSLVGRSTDANGDEWEVTFRIMFGEKNRVSVKANNLSNNQKIYAPKNTSRIIEIWGREFWPPFADQLLDGNSNNNNSQKYIQEGLF